MPALALLCLSLLPLALLVSLAATRAMITLGHRRGWVDKPGVVGHKQHDTAVPVTGGIAIVATVVLPMVLLLAAGWLVSPTSLPRWLAPAAEHLAGLRQQTPMAVAVVVAVLALHIVGLIDDRRHVGPWSKFVVQVIVAVALVSWFDIRILHLLDAHGSAGTVASGVVSVLWIVTVINAMNFLDNMDGLSAGVGAVIAAEYLVATLIAGQWFVAALCTLLLGGLLGFLWFNRHPARIFMGDAGSLPLGLLLAVISVRTTYVATPSHTAGTDAAVGPWYALLMPIVVLAVPLYDLISVTIVRLRAGRSPFVGDNNHLSHRLVRRGFSRPKAVAIIWGCTLVSGAGGVALRWMTGWQAALVALEVAVVLAALAWFEFGRSKHGQAID